MVREHVQHLNNRVMCDQCICQGSLEESEWCTHCGHTRVTCDQCICQGSREESEWHTHCGLASVRMAAYLPNVQESSSCSAHEDGCLGWSCMSESQSSRL